MIQTENLTLDGLRHLSENHPDTKILFSSSCRDCTLSAFQHYFETGTAEYCSEAGDIYQQNRTRFVKALQELPNTAVFIWKEYYLLADLTGHILMDSDIFFSTSWTRPPPSPPGFPLLSMAIFSAWEQNSWKRHSEIQVTATPVPLVYNRQRCEATIRDINTEAASTGQRRTHSAAPFCFLRQRKEKRKGLFPHFRQFILAFLLFSDIII